MNLEKLLQLNRDNRAAQIYFSILATRNRNFKRNQVQEVIDLARRSDVMVSPAEVRAFFEGLEAADCGRFIALENGGGKFSWIVKATDIVRLLRAHPNDAPEAPATETATPATAALLTHPIRLRPDLTLQFQLPADLTAREAERLGHFLKALVMESAA